MGIQTYMVNVDHAWVEDTTVLDRVVLDTGVRDMMVHDTFEGVWRIP